MIESLSRFFTGPLSEVGDVLFLDPQPALPLRPFLENGGVEAALASFSRRFSSAHPQATASQWSKLYLSRLLPAALIPAIFAGWQLPLKVDQMGVRLDRDGGISGFDLEAAGSPADNRFADLVGDHLPVVISALTRVSGLPAKVIWNNAGNIAEMIVSKAAAFVGGDHEGVREARALFRQRRLPDGAPNLLYEPVRYRPGGDGLMRLRRLCCLRYLSPDLGYCKSCPSPAVVRLDGGRTETGRSEE